MSRLETALHPTFAQFEKEIAMRKFKLKPRTHTCMAAIVLAAFAGAAQAGECPADKVKDGALSTGEMMPQGVTDDVLASIDLAPKGSGFEGEALRLRKLVVQPGGVVPWHDHKTRPANIYIVSGTIEEYRSSCEVPIVHKAGDAIPEFGATHAHWWKNTSNEPAVLLSADIFHLGKMNDHMM
jgi:quercetin dioxygenase-like cupin family protein